MFDIIHLLLVKCDVFKQEYLLNKKYLHNYIILTKM